MKVSGSILAVKSDYFEYARALQYANVDYIHVDIFQEGTEFTIKDCLNFESSYLPLDVHLIFKNVSSEDIQVLNEVNVTYLNVQYETLENKKEIEKIAALFKGNFGIAVTARTPLSVIDQYVDSISQVLFMCSEPGISGAKFQTANLGRIKEVHDRYPSLRLFVDGGIDNVMAKQMRTIGISLIVSGSYLCKDLRQLDMNSYCLKYLNEEKVKVTRNMIKVNSFPLVKKSDSFLEIINVMNHYRLGLVMVVENGRLEGVVADGDIRRCFIKFKEGIFSKTADDLMNRKPFVIDSTNKIEDVFSMLLKIHSGISVVPAIESGKLLGALDLHLGI